MVSGGHFDFRVSQSLNFLIERTKTLMIWFDTFYFCFSMFSHTHWLNCDAGFEHRLHNRMLLGAYKGG